MHYKVFDPFLARDTWHTMHPSDEKIFYQCLHKVVELSDFAAEAMGDYFKEMKNINSPNHPMAEAVKRYVSKAWAVREYLAANR